MPNVVVTLLQNDNFGELARLIDARDPHLSFQPFFISIYRSINAHNPHLTSPVVIDSNLVLFAKFYIWVVANNRPDILEAFKAQLNEATRHEWTSNKFCIDSLDLLGVAVQSILFNSKLSTSEIIGRLKAIERNPYLYQCLLRTQMTLDESVNLYLQGLLGNSHRPFADQNGNFSTADVERELHLQVVLEALTPEDKARLEPAIERGAKLIRTDYCTAMWFGIVSFAALAVLINSEDPQEKQTHFNETLNSFLYAIMGIAAIAASPVLVPTAAVLARTASLGTLEIGRGITEVTTRMSMNTMLSQYANKLAKESRTIRVQSYDIEQDAGLATQEENDLQTIYQPENPAGYTRLQS